MGLGFGDVEEDKDIAIPPPPPPAYGAWRCSVRADPDLVYWARTGEGEREGGVRPPSYRLTDDGIVEEPEQVVVREPRESWGTYVRRVSA